MLSHLFTSKMLSAKLKIIISYFLSFFHEEKLSIFIKWI